MDFDFSDKSAQLQRSLQAFMDEHVYPAEHEHERQRATSANRFATLPLVEELKDKARAAGLWNLFLPAHHGGLSNLDYAPLAEIMGRVLWCPEVFNCSAPDTGNMEVLMKYGTPAGAAAGRRDPLGLRDDGAGRGLERRHQHRDLDPA